MPEKSAPGDNFCVAVMDKVLLCARVLSQLGSSHALGAGAQSDHLHICTAQAH